MTGCGVFVGNRRKEKNNSTKSRLLRWPTDLGSIKNSKELSNSRRQFSFGEIGIRFRFFELRPPTYQPTHFVRGSITVQRTIWFEVKLSRVRSTWYETRQPNHLLKDSFIRAKVLAPFLSRSNLSRNSASRICLSSKKLFWSSIVSSLNAWKFVFKRNKYSVTFKKDKKYITFEQNLIKRLSCPTKCFYFWAAIIAKWICP